MALAQSQLPRVNGRSDYYEEGFNELPKSSQTKTTSRSGNLQHDLEPWKMSPTQHNWDTSDPTSYDLIMEELDKMDAYVLADGLGVTSFESGPNGLAGLPDVIEAPVEQHSSAIAHHPAERGSSNASTSPISLVTLMEPSSEASMENRGAVGKSSFNLPKAPDQTRIDHSLVEKKYRDNLNTKFSDLQQCVTTHQIEKKIGGGKRGAEAAISCSKKATKLQKGETISRAVDCINQLSLRNAGLETHIELLERRLTVLQKIAVRKRTGMSIAVDTVDIESHGAPAVTKPLSPISPVAALSDIVDKTTSTVATGMHPAVLEKISKRALRHSLSKNLDGMASKDEPSAKRRKFSRSELAKVAISSLVGLALWEGYSEGEESAVVPNGRGLLGIPVELIRHSVKAVFDFSVSAAQIGRYSTLDPSTESWIILKSCLILGGMIYVLMPIVVLAKGWLRDEKQSSTNLSEMLPAPYTIEFCRSAWSTASQSLGIPYHGILFEALALAVKLFKLLIRRVLGWPIYSYLTGTTLEFEIARVKAWDIAIDAQLAGGDADADFGRLLFTFVASMTMEDTPLRLLRKALHVRLVLWNPANTYVGRHLGVACMATYLASHFWRRATAMYESVQELRFGPNDGLGILDVPSHISQLMKQDPEEVFVDPIIIRTARVARNEPLDLSEVTADEGMDAVFGDVAIRSPLDVLAALYSSLTLRKTLLATLVNSRKNKRETAVTIGIRTALATAPPGSVAGMRARAAQAVFFETGRLGSIASALKEMPKRHDTELVKFLFVEPTLASISTTNVRIALRSAVLIAKVTSEESSTHDLGGTARAAMLSTIERMLRNADVTVLGLAAAYRCTRICQLDKVASDDAGLGLKSLMERLELIAASEWSSRYGVDRTAIWFGTDCE